MVVTSDEVGCDPLPSGIIVNHILALAVSGGLKDRVAIDPWHIPVAYISCVKDLCDAFGFEEVILHVQFSKAFFPAGQVSIRHQPKGDPVAGVDYRERKPAKLR